MTSPGAPLLVVVALLVACQPALEPAAPPTGAVAHVEVEARQPPTPGGGQVRVAVPGEPAGGLPVDDLDVAGADLLALWGLPLYRTDAEGSLVPALVDTARVSDDGTRVRLTLHAGSWSDGTPVTARDVEATMAALDGDEQGLPMWLEDTEVVDERTVVLHLHRPTRRWPLLLAATGVLPAHVLENTDLTDLDNPPEVVGGPFRPVEVEPGLRRRFEAHAHGPLGAPGLAGLEVTVVASFDTALGLLGHGEVDAVVGHLAIRPELRVRELDAGQGFDVTAEALEVAAPVGGTEVALRFSQDGSLGASDETRRAVAALVNVRHQVEGLGLGRLPPGPLAELAGEREAGAPVFDDVDAALVLSNEQEAVVATGRLLEAQLRGERGGPRLEGEPTPHDVRRAGDLDAALVVRRQPPWPDAGHYLPPEHRELAMTADAAPTPRDPAGVEAWARAADHVRELPLYRARVAHVWPEHLQGMEPSAWEGTGLASAARWRWSDTD